MTQHVYHPLQKLLHWLMALMIPTLFGVGLWMTGLSYYSQWYKIAPDLHKSFGVLLALLLLTRWLALWWFGKPAPQGQALQRMAASVAHALMYLLLVSIIVTGYLISTEDGRPIIVFELVEIPSFGKLFDNQADIAGELHYWLAWSLIGLVTLHILAALKHHFINKDNTLTRMIGRARP